MGSVVVAIYDAVGGPKSRGIGSDGNPQGPTDAGEFVVAYCAKHKSRLYREWSSIRWGTPLRENGSILEVRIRGKWQALDKHTPVTAAEIKDYHFELYGTKKIPKKWVFNDFGHMTCYYFKDKNKNRKKDKGEKIHPEFIHTTPVDEADSSSTSTITLTESHGCVHVKPNDIDEMRKKAYIKKGNIVVVHPYGKKFKSRPKMVTGGKGPYEIHFYPGEKKILIHGYK